MTRKPIHAQDDAGEFTRVVGNLFASEWRTKQKLTGQKSRLLNFYVRVNHLPHAAIRCRAEALGLWPLTE